MMLYKEFKEMQNNVKKFFNNEESILCTRLILEFVNDETKYYNSKDILLLQNDDITAEQLENTMQKLYNSVIEKSMIIKEEKNIDKQFDILSCMLVDFILLEAINEWSKITNDIIQSLKDKYKDNYLQMVSILDKNNLSLDTMKYLNKENIENIEYDEIDKKYILMKNWQDILHPLWLEIIKDILWDIEDQYIIQHKLPNYDVQVNMRRMVETNAIKLKIISNMCRNIVDIDSLLILYEAGVEKEIVPLVGGKTIGLVVLKHLGLNIPNTYVVSTLTTNIELDMLDNHKTFAIRSSADVEDSTEFSFAGLFNSYLDIQKVDVPKYIELVKQSVENNNVTEYIKVNNLKQPNMSVIIQEYIEPTYSGVWMGSEVDKGILEWINGVGDKLVSGRITPNTEMWCKDVCNNTNSIKVNEKSIGNIMIEYQKRMNKIADFEWCVYNDSLFMLQYRPVTKIIANNITNTIDAAANNENENVYYGIPASPGNVSGRAKYVGRIETLEQWNDNDILMAWFTDPEWVSLIAKSSGVVTAVGGFLCHTAIITRELGIPCVIGIGADNMKKIWEKRYIGIDGDKGIVYEVNDKEV